MQNNFLMIPYKLGKFVFHSNHSRIDYDPCTEFKCKYYGSERVNFSRGKQIANLALSNLKRKNETANGML